MEKLNLGLCGICDTTVIWERVNGRIVQTPQYAEFSFVLSNEMVYRHAVCANCITNLDSEKVDLVVERIKLSWEGEMAGWATEKQFKQMRGLTVEVFDLDENRLKEKHKTHKEEKHKEHLKEVKIQKDLAHSLKEELIA